MIGVAVDAARRNEPEQMQRSAAFFHRPHDAGKRLVLEKRTVTNRTGDARKLLIHDASRADIRMPDLGVAHLPVGKSDRLAGAKQFRYRAGLQKPVNHRRLADGDRVVLRRQIAVPPPVHDYEHHGRVFQFCHIYLR